MILDIDTRRWPILSPRDRLSVRARTRYLALSRWYGRKVSGAPSEAFVGAWLMVVAAWAATWGTLLGEWFVHP